MIGVSIFGAFPLVDDGFCEVWVGVPATMRVTNALWKDSGFDAELELMGHNGFTCRLNGGASSGHGLSQNLMSQLQIHSREIKSAGINISLLCDFLFDQLHPLPGSHRQTSGLLGGAWLTGSDIQAMAAHHATVSEFLGGVMTHPAALIGSLNGYNPLSGAQTRVPPQIINHLESALPHFTSRGYLAVDGQSQAAVSHSLDLSVGWAVTGRRGGLERQMREKAEEENRPLIIVTRQEEAANVMRFVCPNRIIKPERRHLGSLREWMISQVNCHEVEEALL